MVGLCTPLRRPYLWWSPTNALFQQHKRRLYTWISPDGQHRNQIDYILAAKDGEALYSQQKQDQELTVAQTMNSLLPNSDLN